MYPSAAGKIVSHGPYKSVGDLYNIPGLSGACGRVIDCVGSRMHGEGDHKSFRLDSRPSSFLPSPTDAEKSAIKKYESKFITLDPAPEYTIDRINNGLYR